MHGLETLHRLNREAARRELHDRVQRAFDLFQRVRRIRDRKGPSELLDRVELQALNLLSTLAEAVGRIV